MKDRRKFAQLRTLRQEKSRKNWFIDEKEFTLFQCTVYGYFWNGTVDSTSRMIFVAALENYFLTFKSFRTEVFIGMNICV